MSRYPLFDPEKAARKRAKKWRASSETAKHVLEVQKSMQNEAAATYRGRPPRSLADRKPGAKAPQPTTARSVPEAQTLLWALRDRRPSMEGEINETLDRLSEVGLQALAEANALLKRGA